MTRAEVTDATPQQTPTGPLPVPSLPAAARLARRRGALTWAALAIACLFAVPIVSVLTNVFVPSQGTWQHLASTVLPRYVVNTIYLVLGVGSGVLVIGLSTAWLVTMCRFPGRRFFEWALILPLAVPAYVMAFTYTDFLQFTGPVQSLLREVAGWGPGDYWFPQVRSLGGAIAMLALVLYPYVYLLARAAFLEQSVCALEVSRTLGCGPWSSFFRVALPLARPAIAGGVALALMETIADFGAVSLFGIQTFTTGIVRAWFSLGDRVAAAQLSAVLLGFVLAVLVFERWSRGPARYHHTSGRYRHLPDYALTRVQAGLATFVCFLPFALGFLLPAAVLLAMSIEAGDAQFGPRFLGLAFNSFTLAAITALLAVLLAVIMAYGVRLAPNRVARGANRIAAMGYAVPGTVVAVGVLIPFALFDNALDSWMRARFGLSTGLLLTGTIAALVFAYLVRFLAVSLNTVEASLGKIKPSMDDAARSLGQGPAGTLVRVHAPLMWGSLLTAALVVFVDVMKELPATLIMRPFNFDTLAVQAYNLASDERLNEASTAALAIVAVGVLPLIALSRAIARARPGDPGGPR
ncbi:MAG: ABC transporter permease [Kiloniellaceae bacterium]